MLRGPGPLLDAQGNLADVGWARQPVLDCNLENTRTTPLRFFQPWRVKRWDYFGITTPTHFFSFTLADVGYIGTVFAYAVDFTSREYHEETLTIPLARGVKLPRGSQAGESRFDNGDVSLCFSAETGARRLSVHWPGFDGELLAAEVSLALPPEHESMAVVIPMRGKRFYYNRKINCMPAQGWVDYGSQRYTLDPRTCLGNLDWGRGVWEYRSFWVWASASGFLPDRRSLGLNLGFGFGDTSAATENALVLDGRIHKLGGVDFDYDPRDFTRPWSITSPDGRLDLTFTPFLERVARTDFKLLSSEVHQMFGRYQGAAVSDEGETLLIQGLTGWAEEHHARW